MFVPVILGSDKTTVSVGTGHTEYYPLYVSLGNVHNNIYEEPITMPCLSSHF
ncbi:hypothetical protein ID866_11980 [Astraeus odoratus]|nr:hypothetical protein ID866_11980 [Astraeus odoratus]